MVAPVTDEQITSYWDKVTTGFGDKTTQWTPTQLSAVANEITKVVADLIKMLTSKGIITNSDQESLAKKKVE